MQTKEDLLPGQRTDAGDAAGLRGMGVTENKDLSDELRDAFLEIGDIVHFNLSSLDREKILASLWKLQHLLYIKYENADPSNFEITVEKIQGLLYRFLMDCRHDIPADFSLTGEPSYIKYFVRQLALVLCCPDSRFANVLLRHISDGRAEFYSSTREHLGFRQGGQDQDGGRSNNASAEKPPRQVRIRPAAANIRKGFVGPMGKRFKYIREQLHLSRPQMAERIGISESAWQGYESGQHKPGSRVVTKLVNIGFCANWILTGKGTSWKQH